MTRHISRFMLSYTLIAALSDPAQTGPILIPEQALKSAVEQLREMIQHHRLEYQSEPGLFYRLVEQVLAPQFDLHDMGRQLLGAGYASAPAEQRERFAAALMDALFRCYAGIVLDLPDSASMQWMPSQLAASGDEATVGAVLARENEPACALEFRMKPIDGVWKAYDLLIDHVPLLLDFRSRIESGIGGGNLHEMMAQLQRQDG